MAKLVETFQRLQKVEAACAAKDDPAPVYLLDEIVEMARASPEQAQGIADALEKKLTGARSPVVRFKALRVVKHLCTKSCSTFQRCMQRHSSAVRELVHYRGEPDPFKGDVPNARVREFAKEVLEVLYNAAPTPAPSAAAAAGGGSGNLRGRIQGFGSDGPGGGGGASRYGGFSGGSGGGGGGAGGGIGALSHALGDGPIAAGVASVAGAINEFLGHPSGSARAGLSGSRYGGSGSPPRNGGYGGFEPMRGSGGGYNAASMPTAASHGHATSAAAALGSEEALVDDVTAPGGLRPAPDAADLRRFVEAASAMDGLKLAELLRAKMEGPGGASGGGGAAGWHAPLRALCALEAVLQRGASQACGEVAVMFQSEPSVIQALATSHAQQQVRDAARRVLVLLLGEDAAPPAAAAPAAAAPARATVDLLSLDDDAGPAAAAAAPGAPAAAAPLDLLLDLASGPAPAAAATAADPAPLFSGLEVRAGAAAAPPPAATVAAAAAAAAAAASAVAVPSGVAAADELFGGLSLASPAQPAAPAPAAAPAPPQPVAPAPALVAAPAAATAKPQGPLDDLFADAIAPAPTLQQLQSVTAQQQPQQQLLQQPPPQQPSVLRTAPLNAASALLRGVSGSGSASFSPNAVAAAAAAAQAPWTGGLTKDNAAFDFIADELGVSKKA